MALLRVYSTNSKKCGCKCPPREDGDIFGCMNTSASNYNRKATKPFPSGDVCCGCTDESCKPSCLPVGGCTKPEASNYNKWASYDDGTCQGCPGGCYPAGEDIPGCMVAGAGNYNEEATIDDGSCGGCECDCYQGCGGGGCTGILGCTYSEASNYNPEAACDDGTCICCGPKCRDCYGPALGCTVSSASNYDPTANKDDGSCVECSICTCSGACYGDPPLRVDSFGNTRTTLPDCTTCGGSCGGTSKECCPGETGLVCGTCPFGGSCCLCNGFYAPVGPNCECEYVGTEMPT